MVWSGVICRSWIRRSHASRPQNRICCNRSIDLYWLSGVDGCVRLSAVTTSRSIDRPIYSSLLERHCALSLQTSKRSVIQSSYLDVAVCIYFWYNSFCYTTDLSEILSTRTKTGLSALPPSEEDRKDRQIQLCSVENCFLLGWSGGWFEA